MGRFLWTEEEIMNWINKNNDGYKFIRITELKGLNSRILFECPKCHRDYSVCFKNFKRGNRCGCDNGKRNHTYEDVVNITNEINYKISEDDDLTYSYYKKFKLICNNGHIFHMSLNDLLRGHRCPHCMGNAKLTLEYIKDYFRKYSYIVIDDKYINANSKLNVECPNGHQYSVRYSDFYSGKRCPMCNQSSGEQEIARVLDKYGIKYEVLYKFEDCRNKNPLPFDFYLNDYNCCIEYDGEQHYIYGCFDMDLLDLMNRKYIDNKKTQYCKNKNIKLIRIPYWDFDNIEYILYNKLNISEKLKSI